MVVVPFTPSDPAWPTLVAASRTSVVGQRDPCVVVQNSLEYAREGDDLGGAQRLAVMAVDFSLWSRRSFCCDDLSRAQRSAWRSWPWISASGAHTHLRCRAVRAPS
jgi:hypothetical protein